MILAVIVRVFHDAKEITAKKKPCIHMTFIA